MPNNRDRKTKVSLVLTDFIFYFFLQNILSVVEYHGNAMFQFTIFCLFILCLKQLNNKNCWDLMNPHYGTIVLSSIMLCSGHNLMEAAGFSKHHCPCLTTCGGR